MRCAFLIIALPLLIFSCTQSGTNSSQVNGEVPDSLQINMEDTISVEDEIASTEPIDPFDQRIAFTSDSVAVWGFSLLNEELITDERNLKAHWWLKVFHERNRERADDFPTSKDWSSIQEIRQLTFKKNWRIVIEEWTLYSEKSAERWLELALNTERLHHQKPPRFYWVEGSKMYFIMFTTTHDWFEYSDKLIELFTGKTRALLSIMNQPIDLPEFKRRLRGANGSVSIAQPYFFKPDTVGNYYEYFWFHSLRPRHKDKAMDGLKVLTYIYGDSIGNYEDVSEQLIILKAKLNDHNLGLLDLVGTSIADIDVLFGIGYLKNKENIIFRHHKSLLIIHSKDEVVEWLKFVKTNGTIDTIEKIPDELLSY